MTTYYYPSTYGSAASVFGARPAGVRNFVGQGQGPADTYIVITPIAGTKPQKYNVIINYSGPGTGISGVATQTRWSDGDHLEAYVKIPGQGSGYVLLANQPIAPTFHYTFPRKSVPFQFVGGTTTDPTMVTPALCFVAGTMIRTVAGDKAVETLVVGDRVETVSGATRQITWLGHRTLVRPGQASSPIRIAAHAFGESRPARDLFLSPGHPVLVGADEDGDGGHLVPIMCLVNGTTVRHAPIGSVVYWHVELDRHDVLLAEGLAAESYIDLGTRAWFAGADGALLDPDLALAGMPGRCRPVATDGPVVEAERRRLEGVFATRLVAACEWPAAEGDLVV